MDPIAARSVGIVNDKGKTDRPGWHIRNAKRRTHILSVACIRLGNCSLVLECRTCEAHTV